MKTKILVTALVLMGVAFAAFYFLKDQNYSWNPFGTDTQQQTSAEDTDGIDYSPATEKEQQQADELKDEIVNNEETTEKNEPESTNSNTSKKSVSVVVTFAEDRGDSIHVGAFAQTKTKGTCKLTATKGSKTYTESVGSSLQPSYYQCDGFEFSQSKLGETGNWNVVVTFESSTETGKSQSTTLEVK